MLFTGRYLFVMKKETERAGIHPKPTAKTRFSCGSTCVRFPLRFRRIGIGTQRGDLCQISDQPEADTCKMLEIRTETAAGMGAAARSRQGL